jgi:prolyl 4-hydroxylase
MEKFDLRRYVRVYDDDLDPDLCQRLIAAFAAHGQAQQPNGRGIRAGLEHSAWTELDLAHAGDAKLAAIFRRKVDFALTQYNRDVDLPIAVPNSPRTAELILKRYRPATGEAFQLHFDSIGEVANRYLVFIWYLNDVAQGGETAFPALDLRIDARAGRLLMFPPYWLYQHAGLPPVSGDKYILSTYLLF